MIGVPEQGARYTHKPKHNHRGKAFQLKKMATNENVPNNADPDDRAMEKERPALKLSVVPRHNVVGIYNSLTRTQICATITGSELTKDRAPIDLIVALDVSYSMMGDKLELCKKSLELVLRSLHRDDRFGLVSFSDQAVVEIPMKKLTPEHRQNSLAQIYSLQPKFHTNISDAIRLAAQEMRAVSTPNQVRTIFLLTDGRANRGMSRPVDLVPLTKRLCLMNGSNFEDMCVDAYVSNSGGSWALVKRFPMAVAELETEEEKPKGSSITIHTFGYGSDHDSEMLQSISQATPGGTYYFVQDDRNVFTGFGDAMGGVLSVVAQNVLLQISVPKESEERGVEIVKVYHENNLNMPDGSYLVSLGDVYAEESKDVLFEVTLAAPSNDGEYWMTHATASLSFTDTLAKETPQVTCPPVPCDIARITGSATSAANPHVKAQFFRVRAAEAIANAEKLMMGGNIEEASSGIGMMLDAICMTTDDVRSDPLVQQLIADLARVKQWMSTHEVYSTYGRHQIRNTLGSHKMQRCMDSDGTNRSNVYRGSLKAKTSLNFGKGYI